MPAETPITIEQIRKAARKLSQLRPAYATILSFYENVFTLQEKAKSDIDLEPIPLSREQLERRRQRDLPLVDVPAFTIDRKAGKRLLNQLCELIETHGTGMRKSAAAVSGAVARRELQPQNLFERLLRGDDRFFQTTANRTGTDKNALAFIAYNSIAPSLELCAVQLSCYLDREAVRSKKNCPVCGSFPSLAVLGEEGRRELHCSFCRHHWKAPRIFCAFCENTTAAELHYFFGEEEKDMRVDVCEGCRKYIKTVDGRVVSRPVFAPLEQVASLHLDIIAAEKGFSGGANLHLES
ncbi:MAG: formate dehydrogenase accessory protein FdhE [Desulfosarcina sp.]|nr:formate dehydrogenase accessory protein FdhE [Desulfobacterales bacterium]